MKEVDIQAEMLKSVLHGGGFGWKLSNRFLVGVPDLLVQYPSLPTALIEVKMTDTHLPEPGIAKSVKVGVSVHQDEFLRGFRIAGGVSGWVLVSPVARGRYRMAVSSLSAFGRSFPLADAVIHDKVIGQQWPIHAIVQQLTRECHQ